MSVDGARIVPLAGEPVTTPRLTVRWLRWHALRAAERIDPASADALDQGVSVAGLPVSRKVPVQVLLGWEANVAAHERVMDELRAGARFELRLTTPFVSFTATPLHPRAKQLREVRRFARAV
ncbi:hypothetical protein [Streptomyces sp. UNOC14_S4]|uniref:hypothetical protein n=1 Tax=Streptomyces sp. UNOC14_S4 TaxID=2872340 RepID=UPI001E289BDA|nr:hypothetical protein [Streptomyces sp. UNOC14_S4]MCC3767994.1 hypothetical protein [Streptomyces sp. UNOC14_S4]